MEEVLRELPAKEHAVPQCVQIARLPPRDGIDGRHLHLKLGRDRPAESHLR